MDDEIFWPSILNSCISLLVGAIAVGAINAIITMYSVDTAPCPCHLLESLCLFSKIVCLLLMNSMFTPGVHQELVCIRAQDLMERIQYVHASITIYA